MELNEELVEKTKAFISKRCNRSKDGEDSIERFKSFIENEVDQDPVVEMRSICIACIEMISYADMEWLKYRMFNEKGSIEYKRSKIEFQYTTNFYDIMYRIAKASFETMDQSCCNFKQPDLKCTLCESGQHQNGTIIVCEDCRNKLLSHE